jgi:hypothetical protein
MLIYILRFFNEISDIKCHFGAHSDSKFWDLIYSNFPPFDNQQNFKFNKNDSEQDDARTAPRHSASQQSANTTLNMV